MFKKINMGWLLFFYLSLVIISLEQSKFPKEGYWMRNTTLFIQQ